MKIHKLTELLECFEGLEVYITIAQNGQTYRTKVTGVILDDLIENDGSDGGPITEKPVLYIVGGEI